ncbi:hypothetical protein DSO57_1011729 [Entomophthora muscae]|uniref:Uncharacterized protein n=1 Tax=Entomophthora muscae TaxID=34485 RepID=A0ACC2T634_9FUNG|nr:hypothetical protein DSO57_1011729 [Entomophthora muscae]
MVLTTGAVSPLVIPFSFTLSGSLPPPIQEPTSPEIISPPIEEDIANLPIIPTVLNLGNDHRLVAYPMGTPDLEQVMVVAMNASLNILDKNLSSFKEAELFAPLFVSESSKGNGNGF